MAEDEQNQQAGQVDHVKEIKDFRVLVDGLIKTAAYYRAHPVSIDESVRGAREMAIVHTKLQEAKMWLGMVLEDMGHKVPEEFRDEADPEAAGGIA